MFIVLLVTTALAHAGGVTYRLGEPTTWGSKPSEAHFDINLDELFPGARLRLQRSKVPFSRDRSDRPGLWQVHHQLYLSGGSRVELVNEVRFAWMVPGSEVAREYSVGVVDMLIHADRNERPHLTLDPERRKKLMKLIGGPGDLRRIREVTVSLFGPHARPLGQFPLNGEQARTLLRVHAPSPLQLLCRRVLDRQVEVP